VKQVIPCAKDRFVVSTLKVVDYSIFIIPSAKGTLMVMTMV
jgi:hypothetical protein